MTYAKKLKPHKFRIWHGKRPLLGQLDIELTERCDNNCIHCCINLPQDYMAARSREMGTDFIKDVITQAADLGCLTVRFTGGEPLLREDLAELYEFTRRLGMQVILFTNGRLITPELAALLARIPPGRVVEISVYGMRSESYDRVVGKKGAFAEFRRGVALLEKHQIPFIVKAPLLPFLKDDLEEFESWAQTIPRMDKKPSYSMNFDLRSRRDDPAKNARIVKLRASPEETVTMLARHPLYLRDMKQFCGKFMGPPGDKLFACGAGHGTCIDAYGKAQMCMGLRDPGTVYDLRNGLDRHCEPGEAIPGTHAEIALSSASGGLLAMTEGDDRLFARCIAGRRDFHVDPYGGMTFCSFLKDPAMRYDLHKGTVRDAWETFIPSLADKVHGGAEYDQNCAACDKRKDCRWCPVYGWLEHGRFSAPVEHLCAVAGENKRFKEAWQANHRRYYRIAGITIQVDSDLPIDDRTFHPKFAAFRTDGHGADTVTIRHHFEFPDLTGKDLGRELYRKPPWAISRQNGSYIYLGISPRADDPSLHRVATFNADHTRGRIYNDDVRGDTWQKGDLHSLTMFPSDQILIARLLADRQGCYLHSAGAIINGAGMLFVGHSDAGKSTITRLLMAHSNVIASEAKQSRISEIATSSRSTGLLAMTVEILCDDRNIVRKCFPSLATTGEGQERIPSPLTGEGQGGGEWRVYGTWSHGDVPVVSANDAPLRAICFIEKANGNTITPLTDRKEITRRLLACVIKPFVTADWWNRTLDLIAELANEAPCYIMRFDKSGEIVGKIKRLIGSGVQRFNGWVIRYKNL